MSTEDKKTRPAFNEALLPQVLRRRKKGPGAAASTSLVETVRQEAERQIGEMLRRAKRVAEKEKELAEREAGRILSEAQEEMDTAEQLKRARHQASLTIKRHVMIEKHKEHLVEAFLNDLPRRFREFPRDEHYTGILTRLIADGVSHLDGGERTDPYRFTVRVSAEDLPFLYRDNRFEAITGEVNKACKNEVFLTLSEEGIDTAGGCLVIREPSEDHPGLVVEDHHCLVVFHNTFEEILYRHKEELLVILFEVLEEWRQYDS